MTTKGFESPKTTIIAVIFICTALLFLPTSASADSDNETIVDSAAVETDVFSGSVDHDSPDSSTGSGDSVNSSAPAVVESSPTDQGDSPEPVQVSSSEAEPAAGGDNAPDLTGSENPEAEIELPAQENSFDTEPAENPDSVENYPDAEPAEEASVGNSYMATITPDAVVSGGDDAGYTGLQGGETGDFTVTFTEVGKQALGSARVEIPDQFTVSDFSTEWSTDGVTTEDGKQWQARLEENGSVFIYLRALTESSYLLYGESVSVGFSATTPTEHGVYQFETKAWTDNSAADSGSNSNIMAAGYTDPVVIVGAGVGSAASFDNIRDDLNGHYVLTADIDLADSADYSDDWEPLGETENTPFSGSLHGNGYTISNTQMTSMNIDSTYTSGFGLFGYLNNAWLVNLELVDFIINIDSFDYNSTNWALGGLSGYSVNSHVINSAVMGSISFDVVDPIGEPGPSSDINFINIGGLLGVMNGGTISGCSAEDIDISINFSEEEGSLSMKGFYTIGGLIGISNVNAAITDSYAGGEIRADANLNGGEFLVYPIGGLVGFNEGSITDSHADLWFDLYISGSALEGLGIYNIGGLVGNTTGVVQRSYAAGVIYITIDVDGAITEYAEVGGIGGLVGFNDGFVDESFSTTGINILLIDDDPENEFDLYCIGGLSGRNNGTISNSYTFSAITCEADTDGDVWFYEIGGLSGYSEGSIENSFAAGSIELSWTSSSLVEDIGGLVGLDEGTITNSFYDSQTYDPVYSEYWPLWNGGVYDPADDPAADQRRTTAQLQVYDTFDSAGWSITGVGGAYPALWWQDGSDPVYVWYLPDTGYVPDLIDIHCGCSPGVTSYAHPGYIQPWRHPYPVSYHRALPQTGGDNSLLLVIFLLLLVGTSLHLLTWYRFRNELHQ